MIATLPTEKQLEGLIEEAKKNIRIYPPPVSEGFKEAVITGLSRNPNEKCVKSEWLYDEPGGKLFKMITEQDEYYPTRCEIEALEGCVEELAGLMDSRTFNLVELGAGTDGVKAGILIYKFLRTKGLSFNYVPVDISKEAVLGLMPSMQHRFPHLRLSGIVTDFIRDLGFLRDLEEKRNLIFFPGSSIGNLDFDEARTFLDKLRKFLSPDSRVLIGFDLKKSIELMDAAYNDKAGITAEFNLNLLTRMNTELKANFDLAKFRHYESYDPPTGAMKSYLISLEDQEVVVAGIPFHFQELEPISVEYSYKYLLTDIEKLATDTGFRIVDNFCDDKRWFVDSLWQVVK